MTLAEAVDWISQHDKCSRREATRQIRAALADNAIGPLRWEDQRPQLPLEENYAAGDYPPLGRQFWQVEARIRRARIFDPYQKRWRVLLMSTHSVSSLWPAAGRHDANKNIDFPRMIPLTPHPGGRPSGKDQIYAALSRLKRDGHRVGDMSRARLARKVAERCGKNIDNDAGWSMRTVTAHIATWLSETSA